MELNVKKNTSAFELYDIMTAWMNVDFRSLSIEVCRIGSYVEGMGHILTQEDAVWNGVYNFH
jgi:hypothetical protein